MVIEIGPGIGSLTEYLASYSGEVICIEIDKTLIPVLNKNLESFNNVKILNEDILKTDINSLIKQSKCKNIKIIANLPYYITTPILIDLLEGSYNINNIVVMIQKEVADRINSSPKNKIYGALTLVVQYYADVEIISDVSPSCFIPMPKVSSSIIKLNLKKHPDIQTSNKELLFKIIKASFQQRRKTLVNCLYGKQIVDLSKEEIENSLEACGFNKSIRGEALSLQDFIKLTEYFTSKKK